MSRLGTFLTGVTIVDLSQYIAGPMASLMLADMGAEVVKIEPPGRDSFRELGPRDVQGEPIFYNAVNAGKRIRILDLKDPAGREELLEQADVLIEGFRPGVMARLGLDYDAAAAINPALIYCSLSGYGAEGPLTRTPGHDANYLALTGVLARNGSK